MTAIVLAMLALGCGSKPEPPINSTNFRATVQLPMVTSARSSNYRATIQLTETEAASHAEIIISNFWWSVTTTINGHQLGPVTGGVFPAAIDIGEYLRAGENTIEMRFNAPSDEASIVTGGERGEPRVVGGDWRAYLEFSPAFGFESLAFPMIDGELTPRAVLREGMSEGIVRFFAALDGELIQELGSVVVSENLEVVGAPIAWTGEVWGFDTGGNALYEFGAELISSGGVVVDRSLFRAGVRDVRIVEGSLNLGEEPATLIGVRVENGWESLSREIAPLAPIGINALELHGAALREGWLSEADELGLPLVVLPRCDGNVNVNTEEIERNSSKLAAQDEALIESVVDHPSVLIWTYEGQEQSIGLLSRSYQRDLLGRPIAGVDFPTRSIALARNRQQGSYASSWVVEVTQGPGMDPSTAVMALGNAIDQGAIGGILPLPNTSIRSGWMEALSRLSEDLDRVEPDGFRSMSEVQVLGLSAGDVVYLEAPLTGTVGAVAGADGSASISVWYAGEATLRVGDVAQSVAVRPNVWRGFNRSQESTQISWVGNTQ